MQLFSRLAIIAIFITILIGVIGFARGYRLDLQKQSLTSTGILAISSYPTAAKIYVNGELKGVTNTNLTLPPGSYQVEVKKDGYTSWSKQVSLKGELVLTLEPLLLPLNPSLSPMTNLGIVYAVPVDQTGQIILFTENGDPAKDGIFLYEASRIPLSFLSPLKLLLLKQNLPTDIDFVPKTVYFSPDYKQAIFEFVLNKYSTVAYLLSLDSENTNVFDITASEETLLAAWEKQKTVNNQKILETFPKEIAKVASDSFRIISFSPSETKVLYQATAPVTLPLAIKPPLIATNQTTEVRTLIKDHWYVYDRKEDKNFEFIGNWKLETGNLIEWYPDSRHLLYQDDKKISIIEYDGGNIQTVYSGPFDKSFFTVTSDGSPVILTNLNPEANKLPDLYAVGIK